MKVYTIKLKNIVRIYMMKKIIYFSIFTHKFYACIILYGEESLPIPFPCESLTLEDIDNVEPVFGPDTLRTSIKGLFKFSSESRYVNHQSMSRSTVKSVNNTKLTIIATVLGKKGVGKTSFISLIRDQTNKINPESSFLVGNDIMTSLTFDIIFWEISGDPRHKKIEEYLIGISSIKILVFDCAIRDTYFYIRNHFENYGLRNRNFIVVENQCSIQNERSISENEIDAYFLLQSTLNFRLQYGIQNNVDQIQLLRDKLSGITLI